MRKLCLLLGVLAGCVVDEIVDEYSEIDAEIVSNNRIALNRIALNGMARASLQLEGERPGSLLDSESGRDLMSYVVSCALPAGQTASFKTSTGAFSYPGGVGLAPAWWTRTPTDSERRWVSACLLARTNKYGVSVDVSMRGSHPSLNPAQGERLEYALYEGAFWGDVFSPNGSVNACLGLMKETNGVLGTVLGLQLSSFGKRDCAISDDGRLTRCGFKYAGMCALVFSKPTETINVYLSSRLL